MTTQKCADILNALAGDRLFDDRMMRQRVEDGELECTNPGRRARQRIQITPSDFCAYVQRYHPQLLKAVKERLGVAA